MLLRNGKHVNYIADMSYNKDLKLRSDIRSIMSQYGPRIFVNDLGEFSETLLLFVLKYKKTLNTSTKYSRLNVVISNKCSDFLDMMRTKGLNFTDDYSFCYNYNEDEIALILMATRELLHNHKWKLPNTKFWRRWVEYYAGGKMELINE